LVQNKGRVVSLTTHFTTMINAVLTAPDHAPPLQFNPNSIKDFAAADPAQNIDLIEPPAANNRGTAELSFPIRLPAGRGAYSPQLTLTYSSDSAYSWVGHGWNIDLPQIGIDTRWGVPRYDYAAKGKAKTKDYTKERYLLNGQSLVPVTFSAKCRTENSETLAQFAPRIQNFQRILMCSKPSDDGSNVDRYWEITNKDGTYFEYGSDEMSRLASYRKGDDDHIATWYLRRVIDTNGNIAEYKYEKDTEVIYKKENNLQKYPGEPFVRVYPKEILYTSHVSKKPEPAYKVFFKRVCTDPDSKAEYPIRISGRNGFKVVSRCRLETIDVYLVEPEPDDKLIRSYEFKYQKDNYFGKQLLDKVQVKGDNAKLFYEHNFEYYKSEYAEAAIKAKANNKQISVNAFKNTTLKSNVHKDLKPKLLSYTRESGDGASFGLGAEFSFEVGGVKAGCGIDSDFRLEGAEAKPILRHMDVNGDRIPDRVWLGKKGVSIMVGSDKPIDPTTDPPPIFEALNLSNIGRDRTIGSSGGVSAGCNLNAGGFTASAGGGLTISNSVTGTRNMLADANGDGLVDLTWGDKILPGLPSQCRDWSTPNCTSTDPICQCNDGLWVCNKKDALCFGKSFNNPNSMITSQASSIVPLASDQGAQKIAQAVSRLPIKTDQFRTRKGFNIKNPLLVAEAHAAKAPAIDDPLDKPPVVRKASGPWGAYTAIINRYKGEADRDQKNFKKPPSYRSVIRWDAQHTGTIKIDAQVRRSFITPNIEKRDGLKVSLLHVRNPTLSSGTQPIESVLLGPDETEIKSIVSPGTTKGVKFGDSILVVIDALKDFPLDHRGTPLDQVRLKLHIEFASVCLPAPELDSCDDLTPDDKLDLIVCEKLQAKLGSKSKHCRTLTAGDLQHRGPTGERAYVYDFPADFRTSELPRMAYWQLLPPIGPPRRDADGHLEYSKLIGTVRKIKATQGPVHVRVRCEPFVADPTKPETFQVGEGPCSKIGDILWEHTFKPEELSTMFMGYGSLIDNKPDLKKWAGPLDTLKKSKTPIHIRLPSPFIKGKGIQPEDLVVLVRKHLKVRRYSDLNRVNIKIYAGKMSGVARYYFPLAEIIGDTLGTQAIRGYIANSLAEGAFDAALVSYDNARAELKIKPPVAIYKTRQNLPKICCPMEQTVGLGQAGDRYVPRRLLFEVDGENGAEIPPDAIKWDPTMKIVSIHELEDQLGPDQDDYPILVVSKGAVKGHQIETYEDLNRLKPRVISSRLKDDKVFENFLKQKLPNLSDMLYLGAAASDKHSSTEVLLKRLVPPKLGNPSEFTVSGYTAGVLPHGEYLELLFDIERRKAAGEKIDPLLANLQDYVFTCCPKGSSLPDHADNLLLVRDVPANSKAPKDIRSYIDVVDQNAKLAVVTNSAQSAQVQQLFPGIRKNSIIPYKNADAALSNMLAGSADAVLSDSTTIRTLLKKSPSVPQKTYTCCPRDAVRPVNMVKKGVNPGPVTYFKPEDTWLQAMPVLYRVHPSRQLIPVRVTEANQSLYIRATVNCNWVPGSKPTKIPCPREPLFITVTGDQMEGELLREKIAPKFTTPKAMTKRIKVKLPQPGLYYIRGYTEATLATPGTLEPTYDLKAWIKTKGIKYKALISLEASRDFKIKSYEDLGNGRIALFVVADTPGESWAERMFPDKKNLIRVKNITEAVNGVLNGHEGNKYTAALLEARTIDLLPPFLGFKAKVCCGTGPMSYLPIDWKPADTNLLKALLTDPRGKRIRLRRPPPAEGENAYLVGELPYSLEQWSGGHKGFFYGQFNTDEKLTCIGPYPCNDTKTAPKKADSDILRRRMDKAAMASQMKTPTLPSAKSYARAGKGAGKVSYKTPPSAISDSFDKAVMPDESTPINLFSALSPRSIWAATAPRDESAAVPRAELIAKPNVASTANDCNLDSDGDGVPNCRDKCTEIGHGIVVDELEDYDGIEDEDGCLDGPNPPYELDGDYELPGDKYLDILRWKTLAFPGDCYLGTPLGFGSIGCDGSVSPPGPHVPGPGSGGGDGDGDDGDGGSGSLTLGPTLRRSHSFGITTSLSAGFGVGSTSLGASLGANASWGHSSSYTDQEYFDWNGDGLPDRIAPNEIVFSGTDEPLIFEDIECILKDDTGDCLLYPGVRESNNTSVGLGVGFSGYSQIVSKTLTSGGRVKEQKLSGGASAGVNLNVQSSHSSTTMDRMDVNGDGLPDIVYTKIVKDKGQPVTRLMVRLNLGYHLGKAEEWGNLRLPAYDEGKIQTPFRAEVDSQAGMGALARTENFTNGISATVGGGADIWIFGLSIYGTKGSDVTAAVTNFAFADINGDGLPDLVAKHPGENKLHVRFNRGGSLGSGDEFLLVDEKELPIDKKWSISFPESSGIASGAAHWVQDAFDEPQDTLMISGSDVENISGRVKAKIFFVTISAAYYHKTGHSFTQLGFYDVDGDGLPDRVLRPGNGKDDKILVQRNRLGKANLLKAVNRPLGGRLELEYLRQSPSVEDPNSRWLYDKFELSQSGLPSTVRVTPIHRDFDYDSPYFDRYERDFFGHQKVTTRREDLSGSTSEFANRNYWKKGLQVYSKIFGPAKEGASAAKYDEPVYQETVNTYQLDPQKKDSEQSLAPNPNCINQLIMPLKNFANSKNLPSPCNPVFVAPKSNTVRWCEGCTVALDENKNIKNTTDFVDTTVHYEKYDQFGNVTQIRDDQVSTDKTDDLTATIGYTHELANENLDYKTLTDKHILDRPIHIEVYSVEKLKADKLVRKREGVYDDRGNLKTHATWADEAGNQQTKLSFEYTPSGFMERVEDTSGYYVEYTPDDVLQMFAKQTETQQTEDAFKLTSNAVYNYAFQEQEELTDSNGNKQIMHFDPYGRMFRMQGPYELKFGMDSDSMKIDYSVTTDPSLPAFALTTNTAVYPGDPSKDKTTIRTINYIDAMGRTLQTQVDAEVEITTTTGNKTTLEAKLGRVISGQVKYDTAGRKKYECLPEFQKGSNFKFELLKPDSKNKNCTEWKDYDALDRAKFIVKPGERNTPKERKTEFVYSIDKYPTSGGFNFRRTKIIDPENKKHYEYRNVIDRLKVVEQEIEVVDPQTGTKKTTRYDYLPTGELQSIEDANKNTSTFEYDLAGRRTAVNTPDTGRLEFGYDDNGNLTDTTDQKLCPNGDPKNLLGTCSFNKIHYGYTKNRLNSITYPNDPPIDFVYGDDDTQGACSGLLNTKGRICSVLDAAGSEKFSYGDLGEVIRTTRVTFGAPWEEEERKFTTQFIYDSFGRMLSLKYPDGETLTYGYDKGGQVKAVRGKKKNRVLNYVNAIHYNALGQRTLMAFGNGAVNRFTYEDYTQRLHEQQVYLVPPANIKAMKAQNKFTLSQTDLVRETSYDYDKADNITAMNDTRYGSMPSMPSESNRIFTYDDLHRLKIFNFNAKQLPPGVQVLASAEYGYDKVGNLKYQDVTHQNIGPPSTAYPARKWDYTLGNSKHPNLPNTVGGPKNKYTYTYDARGSVLSALRGENSDADAPLGNHYTWNDAGQLLTSIPQVKTGDAAVTTGYTYTYEGQRIKKQTPANIPENFNGPVDATVYPNAFYNARFTRLGEPCEENSKPCWGQEISRSKHIYVDGQRVATTAMVVESSDDSGIAEEDQLKSTPETHHYFHANPVQSVVFITDQPDPSAKARVVQEIEYLPFGEVVLDHRAPDDPAQPQLFRFDGKELDPETGLQYFGARYYDPKIGRWLSADPLYQREPEKMLDKPSELNLYVFGSNNPISTFDETGLENKPTVRQQINWLRKVDLAMSILGGVRAVESGARGLAYNETKLGKVLLLIGSTGGAISGAASFGGTPGSKLLNLVLSGGGLASSIGLAAKPAGGRGWRSAPSLGGGILIALETLGAAWSAGAALDDYLDLSTKLSDQNDRIRQYYSKQKDKLWERHYKIQRRKKQYYKLLGDPKHAPIPDWMKKSKDPKIQIVVDEARFARGQSVKNPNHVSHP
jgi:RHS repeat-associated protein